MCLRARLSVERVYWIACHRASIITSLRANANSRLRGASVWVGNVRPKDFRADVVGDDVAEKVWALASVHHNRQELADLAAIPVEDDDPVAMVRP